MNGINIRVTLILLSGYMCMSPCFSQTMQSNESETINKMRYAENHCRYPDLNEEENLYCDADCCRDEGCSEDQLLHDYIFKNEQEDILRPWICTQNDFAAQNWLHALCIFLSKTPYLGRFFPMQTKIESVVTLKNVLQKENTLHSFGHDMEVKHTTGNLFYKYGSPIIFVTNIDNLLALSNRAKYLQMPSNVLGGGFCIDFSPVHFLFNHKSYCLRKLTKESCIKPDSIFSLRHYGLIDSKENVTLYQIAQNAEGAIPIETEFRYLCIGDNKDYVTFSNAVRQNSNILPNWEEGKESPQLSKCNLSSEHIAYAMFNEDKEMCQNVLISLFYDIVWRGTELLNVTATYVLADVPVTLSAFSRVQTSAFPFEYVSSEDKDNAAYLTQYFEVRFKHHSGSDMNVASTDKQASGYTVSSGYLLGQPVITLSNNESLFQWEEDLLYRWSKAGSCSEVKPLEFGFDILTFCFLEIDSVDLLDCDNIRNIALQEQESLLTGDGFSGGGVLRNNHTTAENFVPLLREPYTAAEPGDSEESCGEVPMKQVIHIMYTRQHVPESDGHSFNQIVGAKLRYDTSNWVFDVTSEHQILTLTSQVIFIAIPPEEEKPVSRFWERMRSMEGSETAWLHLLSVVDLFQTGEEILEASAYAISLFIIGCLLLFLSGR